MKPAGLPYVGTAGIVRLARVPMLIWIVFAVLTFAAVLAVLLPLAARRRAAPDAAHDVAVYTDQLAELERDRARGLIGESEAEAARTEIARRLLRADASAREDGPQRRSIARPVAVAITVFVPLAALGLYLDLGSPDAPDQPLEARLEKSNGEHDIAAMVAQVEAHLGQNPNDAQGWQVIAPIYMRLGRYQDAADAWRKVVTLGETGPDAEESFGEALVAANQGIVTAEAQAAFDRAVKADPDRIKARFYRALGLKQAGRNEEALAGYDALIAASPADAPWLDATRTQRGEVLAALGRPKDTPAPATLPAMAPPAPTAAPGPGAADVAAAAGMSEADRKTMIEGMVQRLADRLAADPKDAEGWQRLIRAYGVLGRTADAKAAYEKAKATFAGDGPALQAIDAVAKEAGVSG